MKEPLPTAAELLASIAHDLKNPLAAVTGNADYLRGAAELTADSHESLTELLEGAKSIEVMLADLATLAAALGGGLEAHRRPTDAGAVARKAADATRPRADRLGVVVDVQSAGEPAPVDGALVLQLLRVLLSLALRRAPGGTHVTVATRVDAGKLRIRVLDEGPAVDGEKLAELAAGLRLLVVRAICEAHGGGLRVESPAGGGLLVTAELAPA